MARFTTRVELHGASEDDYEELHAAMAKKGFVRYITTTSGEKLKLPTAEYNYDGGASISEILNGAKAAAESTGQTFAVLVTESAGRTSHGLDTYR